MPPHNRLQRTDCCQQGLEVAAALAHVRATTIVMVIVIASNHNGLKAASTHDTSTCACACAAMAASHYREQSQWALITVRSGPVQDGPAMHLAETEVDIRPVRNYLRNVVRHKFCLILAKLLQQ